MCSPVTGLTGPCPDLSLTGGWESKKGDGDKLCLPSPGLLGARCLLSLLVMSMPTHGISHLWPSTTCIIREDSELAQGLPAPEAEALWRDLASAAESGWDFSTRWMLGPSVAAGAGDTGGGPAPATSNESNSTANAGVRAAGNEAASSWPGVVQGNGPGAEGGLASTRTTQVGGTAMRPCPGSCGVLHKDWLWVQEGEGPWLKQAVA